MGCQQSRNTVPTEYLEQDDQDIQNFNDEQKIRNLFQNIDNNQDRQPFKQGVCNQQVPQAKGCRYNEAPTKGLSTSNLSKKFNESRTLDLINNELFSNRVSQSARDSKRFSVYNKQNNSILKEFRQKKQFQKSNQQNKQSISQNQWQIIQMYNQQNQKTSVDLSQISFSSALSSQLQVRFQSTLRDLNKIQNKEQENEFQPQSQNTIFSYKYHQKNQDKENIEAKSQKKQQMIESARQIMSIRSGKSIQVCEEEYDCIKYMIFEKMVPQMVKKGSPFTQFQNEITHILEKWGQFVHQAIIQQTGEIRNFVSIRNTNDYIRITHELSCWKQFSVLEQFVLDVLNQPVNFQYLDVIKNNAQKIKALSCFVWIELSYQKDINKLDIQVGVSEKQPYDKRILQSLIINKNERSNIMDWYNIAQPIANEYGFIINSQHIDEIYDFYIFENDEKTNLKCSLQAFYNYGAQFSKSITDVLDQIPGNDFHVMFHLNRFGLLNLKLSLQSLNLDEESIIFDDILSNLDSQKQQESLKSLWEWYNQYIFNEENVYTLHYLELNPDGLYLYKTREISIDEDSQI
ncbi:hypothetical protein TTHERM_00442130 (macronuclear) [Tetrahymena thermophila SB210]|uniref:Uncharacterized protein n=1 Tax=Tetrahymena thermophila (strain SB210) TaxID=312017 RepID=I7M045_TETTS|nr:hypothetical protein TTHERM_00442130 [Tetrahymena thermophila SB210]EAR85463.1 hypothetical protein TTHERM_00442130 [Tetrahymena thermophila SB210]|eukprot:XP_001033126.1 hypothetical protein TTHERM_00442130 [Tetrahymena thermophila SB210]